MTEAAYAGGAPHILSEDLFKIYKIADLEVVALRGLDLRVQKGEVVAIVGASGSGKSTLLNILAGYDTPSAGQVTVGERNLLRMGGREVEQYRRYEVGFVWQQTGRNLFPYLTAIENVVLPMMLTNQNGDVRQGRAKEILELVGLSGRMGHRPAEMSGGEQQRVAIAVALANRPPLLLADEPTGELDDATAGEIVDQVGCAADDGDSRAPLEEFVLIDASGRVQIPRGFLDDLKISERARIYLDDDSVTIRPENFQN